MADTRRRSTDLREPTVSMAAVLLHVAAATAQPAYAPPPCAPVEAAEVASWFDGWNLALASLDPDRVTQRYWDDAVLMAPSAPATRYNSAQIREYFQVFLAQHPRGHIESRSMQIGCNIAIDAGLYTFSLMDEKGAVREVPARFTYVYAFRNGEWRIAHHHSSTMPEPAPVAVAVAGSGVKPAAPSTTPVAAAKAEPEPQRASSPMFMNAAASPGVMEFYPIEARVARETGSVGLRVCAGPDGVLVGDPAVLRSSGSERLDAAARSWARAARWVPATSNRRAVEGCVELTARFEPK
jgi:uncharacterized protein (TIGR02246 family)